MLEPLLLISLGFCHTGKEVERLYTDEDKNAFLSTFSETIEDQMTRVSVRASVIEMIQLVCLEAANNRKEVVETVLNHLWCNNVPEGVLATTAKLQKLTGATTVAGIDVTADIAYQEP